MCTSILYVRNTDTPTRYGYTLRRAVRPRVRMQPVIHRNVHIVSVKCSTSKTPTSRLYADCTRHERREMSRSKLQMSRQLGRALQTPQPQRTASSLDFAVRRAVDWQGLQQTWEVMGARSSIARDTGGHARPASNMLAVSNRCDRHRHRRHRPRRASAVSRGAPP